MLKRQKLDTRYAIAALAWDYDQRYPNPLPHELSWYLREIDPDDPRAVLELACGSGRLTLPLRDTLPDSVTLIGVDNAQAMLDRLRTKLKAPHTQALTLVNADMATYRPSVPCQIVIVAYNALKYVATTVQLRRVLRHFYSLVADDAVLMTDIYCRNPDRFETPQEMTHESQDKRTGLCVREQSVTRFLPDQNAIASRQVFEVEQSGDTHTVIAERQTPVHTRRAFVELFEHAGFAVQAYRDFQQNPLDEDAWGQLCLRCSKPHGGSA